MSARPVRIAIDVAAQSLLVDWNDGVRHRYPWTYLRAHCPSATERSARESVAKNPLQVLSKLPSSELVNVRPVGNYAVSLEWADGHSAGIYTWDLLLQLAGDPMVTAEAIA